ncbi:MAG: SprB repeat-containing protein, partial [Bacteroidota bacterium]|nr:SprB repeat-containing protein [Bacteroidota bacterium]
MKQLFVGLFLFFSIYSNAQNWQTFIDSIPTLSSPRSSDLNGDGVMDVVIGGGTDSVFSNNGIMAYNGVDGSLLWKRPSRNEVFGSAIFQDITADGINDVIIAGRSAQLLAIDGVNGALLWDYFPYSTNPADSGLFNFYNPQFIHDVDGDTYPDILVSNGGDHAAPSWQFNRPPGYLMVVSALTGDLIVKAVVPDSSETYCSPIVADIQNTGDKWILYGTGGENFGGNFYAVLLDDLLLGDLSASIALASDLNKGFVAPAAIHKTDSGVYDIVIQSFDGLVTKIAGQTFSPIWTYQKAGTESSAEPVIGNFTGDLTPDILLVLFKGVAPSYNDYYQVMLDGNDGSVCFLDSLGAINFASANSVDLNNDGRDEGLYSITYLDSGYFTTRVESIDFTTNIINTLDQTRTGVNIASTPLITDLDNDGLLDLVYSVKRDSLNPMGWKGIYVYRHELNSIIPNSGVSWGSYLGTNMDGVYNSELIDCGNGSLISSVNTVHPSCNGFSDGGISLSVLGGSSPYTYLWSNQSTNSSVQNLEAGSYWVQVTDSTGCYELRTINLFDPFAILFGGIIPPVCVGDSNGIATVTSSGCPCMFSGCTYLWDNGVTTTTNSSLPIGWNTVIITHVNGCVVVDSVLINLTVNNSTGLSSETSCDSYTWDGVAYTTSGLYTNTYINISGCDSIHTLNLTISTSTIWNQTYLICDGDSIVVGSSVYDTTGAYIDTLSSANGCDSIIHTYIGMTPPVIWQQSFSICDGDSVVVGSSVYDTTGNYIDTLTAGNGCDSIVY